MSRRKDDLPAPLGPTRASTSPWCTRTLMSSTSSLSPTVRERFLVSSATATPASAAASGSMISGRSMTSLQTEWFRPRPQSYPSCRSLSPQPRRLEEKPRAPLGLVDPNLNEAGAGDVVVLVAKGVRLTQVCGQLAVVISQLGKHVERRNKVCVIVENTLQARYLANRAKRGAPNLPNTFGDGICGREDLIGLLIQELVIVAKMWAGDVPMEVLGFQVKGKHISKQDVECGANVPHRVWLQIRRSAQR